MIGNYRWKLSVQDCFRPFIRQHRGENKNLTLLLHVLSKETLMKSRKCTKSNLSRPTSALLHCLLFEFVFCPCCCGVCGPICPGPLPLPLFPLFDCPKLFPGSEPVSAFPSSFIIVLRFGFPEFGGVMSSCLTEKDSEKDYF